MLGRLLAKLGVTSSTITGVVYFDFVPNNSAGAKSKEDNEQVAGDLNTIEDIELFEKRYGCSFVFVNSWVGKEFYSARAFYELKSQKNQQEEWKNAMIKVLKEKNSHSKDAKDYCKDQKGVITLFDDQDKKLFWLGAPKGGWGT